MTQRWKGEKDGQGDLLVRPLGVSMMRKVNLEEEGFFLFFFIRLMKY